MDVGVRGGEIFEVPLLGGVIEAGGGGEGGEEDVAGFGVEGADGEGVEGEMVAAELGDGLAGLPEDVVGVVGGVELEGDGRGGGMRGEAVRGVEGEVRDGSAFDDDAFEPGGEGFGRCRGGGGLGELGDERAEGGQEFEIDLSGGVEGVDVEETGFGDEGEREGEFGEVERGAVRGAEMEILEMEGGVFEGWRIGRGEVEVGEGVVEGEFEMRGGGVAFELKFEVGKMDGFEGETREGWRGGSGGGRGGGSD